MRLKKVVILIAVLIIQNSYTQKFCKHFTDDSSIFEKAGGKIETIAGDNKNLKITTIEDLKLAEIFMQ